jgi:DNA polymerase I-like protein with 3'-5' exonuclease and polymerase domains
MISVQYGMGENSLALKIKQSPERARELLELHRQTYKEFWRWSESSLNQALLSGKICSVFGWQLFVHEHPNLRSLGNFPMQSNAAEMLRLACCNLTSMGMRVCAPVHDALLIEAPLDELDQAISLTQNVMQEVSSAVLGGFRLRSDVKTVRFPDRFNDPRGTFMWNKVMNQLNLKDRCLL